MAKLPLVLYPDTILKTHCADVLEIDGELVEFCRDMAETMYHSHGVGLAAPQVARNIRMFAMDVGDDPSALPGHGLMSLINPVIVDHHGKTTYEEGCLSFPGITAEVRRKDTVHVKAYDPTGRELDFEAGGLLSICIQHELDHLNGVTFVDRLNAVKRTLVVREYMRIRDDDAQQALQERIEDVHRSE